jgi:hypothetical protein
MSFYFLLIFIVNLTLKCEGAVIEPKTLRLVAKCLNQRDSVTCLHFHVYTGNMRYRNRLFNLMPETLFR